MVSLLQLGKGSFANFHIGVSGVFLYLDAGNQSRLVYNENTTLSTFTSHHHILKVVHAVLNISCGPSVVPRVNTRLPLPTVFLTFFPAMEMFVTRCVLRINRKNVHQEMASLKPYIRTVSGKGVPSPEGAAYSWFLTENGYHGA